MPLSPPFIRRSPPPPRPYPRSDYVFQHLGLQWEWGLCLAALVVYLLVTEAWKYVRRVSMRKVAAAAGPSHAEKSGDKVEA